MSDENAQHPQWPDGALPQGTCMIATWPGTGLVGKFTC